jgi:hypothetical protein
LRCDEIRRAPKMAILDRLTLPAAVSLILIWVRVRLSPHRALVNRARCVSAIRLRSLTQADIMCRSPEALARRAAAARHRYHCPSRGCLVNRSRDCTRSRVPPLRVGAMLTLLRVPLLIFSLLLLFSISCFGLR